MLYRTATFASTTLLMGIALLSGLSACGGSPGGASNSSQRPASLGSNTVTSGTSQSQQGSAGAQQSSAQAQQSGSTASCPTAPGTGGNIPIDANSPTAGSGGNTWTLVPGSAAITVTSGGPGGLYYGYNSNDRTTRLRSVDGGNTWAPIAPSSQPCTISILTANPNQAYGECQKPNQPVRIPDFTSATTDDGGATWQALSPNYLPTAIDPYKASVLYGVTYKPSAFSFGSPYVSVDGGVSWSPIPGVTQTGLVEEDGIMFGASSNDVYILRDHNMLITHDGGTTWVDRAAGVHRDVPFELVGVKGSTIFINALDRELARSTDDGITWTSVTPTCAQQVGVAPTDTNTIYANLTCDPLGGAPANLAVTHDGGVTWVSTSPLPACVAGFAIDTARNSVVAYGCGIYTPQ